eukprot:9114816-Alexandrium_andersonii.AAC.1
MSDAPLGPCCEWAGSRGCACGGGPARDPRMERLGPLLVMRRVAGRLGHCLLPAWGVNVCWPRMVAGWQVLGVQPRSTPGRA